MNLPKELKEIEEKWGVEAYNKLLTIFSRQYQKIEELTKSREEWKKKYFKLKNEK